MNNSDPPNRNAWVPSSAEDSTLVSSALEEILASAPFRGSRRYPAMLRYIVEKTLANQCTELKERTIGIEVFSRDPAYDTNADPVVRFSAGEIRRRLAQFYQESGTASPVILELPSGTYIPKFHLRQQALDNHAVHEAVPHSPELEALIAEAPHTPAETHHPAPQQKHPLRALLGAAALLVLGLAITAAWFFAGGGFKPQDPVRQVWAPLLKMSDPVLISAGRPHTEAEPPEPPNISIGDHILRPEFRVSIATLDAIANLVGYLKTVKKPFHIHEANSNTLDDLHQQPVVLVTGNNNKWTVLLLKPLRFHFIQQGSFSI